MAEEIETAINISTEHGVRVHVSEVSGSDVWLLLAGRIGRMSTMLTRAEAQALVDGLQKILAKDVAA